MTAPHVQRCTRTRLFGKGTHAHWAQCRISPAPHPDRPCDFGVDAEVYGRDLDTQRPEWLAAQLRDAQAQLRHHQRRGEQLTAIAAQLAALAADGSPVMRNTGAWLRANLPTAADHLDALRRPWHDGWTR